VLDTIRTWTPYYCVAIVDTRTLRAADRERASACFLQRHPAKDLMARRALTFTPSRAPFRAS
jgi:hypothetical protein